MNGPPGFRGVFRDDDDARAVYSEAAGIAREIPAAVAVPVDADDLATLVTWGAANGIGLIPRGSGSSMSGGAVGPGVIVDLSRWRRIGDIADRRVRVEPGAVCRRVDLAARALGLRFPVSPSSAAFCTVGGMTATNAAGAHTLAFGATRPWVTAIECVFANGERAVVRRGEPAPDVEPLRGLATLASRPGWLDAALAVTHAGVRKDSSGYGLADFARTGDVVDLLVGSEGTLAFFTAIELALTDAPEATASVVAAFDSLEHAAVAATRACAGGAVACELLDRTFLEIAARGDHPVAFPSTTEAVLLAEVEGDDETLAAAAARQLSSVFTQTGAVHVETAVTPEAERAMWALRHAASPILARLDPALRSMQFIEDGAVPPDRLAEYVRGVRAALDRRGIRGVIFGHAGDAHVHANALIDVTGPEWRTSAAALFDDVVTLTASLGGTLSGEHGDGRLRTPMLPRVWPPDVLAAFADVKHAFDPAGILNPGVIVPDRVAPSPIFDRTKYDLDRPPLPPAAANAIATLERERAYDRFRLDLI